MEWLSPVRGLFEFALPFLDNLPALRAILGFILAFLLPGFAWTLVFFSGRQINIVERLALSFGLSIAIVTLSIMALNLVFHARISGFNSVLIILVITVIPVAFYFLRRLKGRWGSNR